MVLTDLPAFTNPIRVTTQNASGEWEAVDSFGDYMIGIGTIGLDKFYMIIWHYLGGVFAKKPYDGDPYSNWPANASPPLQAIPREVGPSADNADTWTWIQNPLTGVFTAHTSVSPGVRPGGATGKIFCIQRATSTNPTAQPATWTRDPAEVLLEPDAAATWEGPTVEVTSGFPTHYDDGILEQSCVYDAVNNQFVMFYQGMYSGLVADHFGKFFRVAIGRATCPAAVFDSAPVFTRTPAASATSYVFEPTQHGFKPGESYTTPPPGELGTLGTAQVTMQPHVSISPFDGVWHMVLLQARPCTLQNPQNLTWSICHYYSLDFGMTWTADINNPICNLATMGEFFNETTPNFSADFFNSPHLFWDTTARRVYLSFASGVNVYEPNLNGGPFMMQADIIPTFAPFNDPQGGPGMIWGRDEERNRIRSAVGKIGYPQGQGQGGPHPTKPRKPEMGPNVVKTRGTSTKMTTPPPPQPPPHRTSTRRVSPPPPPPQPPPHRTPRKRPFKTGPD